MAEPVSDQIIRKIGEVAGLYHRLVIVAAPSGSGKTAVLREVAERTAYPRINLNLELSRRLLDLTERQRALEIPRLLSEIIGNVQGQAVLLDNVEILFDVNLRQDPLRCLQALSRNRTIVVAWNGEITRYGPQQAFLTYAIPGHPEYRRYSADDLVVLGLLPPQGNNVAAPGEGAINEIR